MSETSELGESSFTDDASENRKRGKEQKYTEQESSQSQVENSDSQIEVIMFEGGKSCKVEESNKLAGAQNYTVWKIKMEAILRRERLWDLVRVKQNPVAYPVTIDGITYMSEERVQSEKQRARSSLILSVVDTLVGFIAGKDDPADSSELLRLMYNSGDQQQILFLTNKLFGLTLKEGSDINVFLTEASDLRTLGEEIPDRQLNNIVLNGLPSLYEMIIQGISYLQAPTFEEVIGKLITETHRMSIRRQKLGHEKALVVQFKSHAPQMFGGNFYRGSGRKGCGFLRLTQFILQASFQSRGPVLPLFQSPSFKQQPRGSSFSTQFTSTNPPQGSRPQHTAYGPSNFQAQNSVLS
jgi:hypothetical protein